MKWQQRGGVAVCEASCKSTQKPQSGFTLLEMIGIMAVVAILALALTPILIKQLDQAAWDKETSQLRAFSTSFRQGVVRAKFIPNETGLVSMIATNLGISTNQVLINDRRVQRIFLIDPDLRIGAPGGILPYTNAPIVSDQFALPGSTQNGGSTNLIPPISPRLMIVSSISKALPSGLITGLGASSGDFSFSNLWTTAERALPTGSSWSSWGGKGEDIKIQRINLSDLFIQVALNNLDTGSSANYAIDGVPKKIAEGTTIGMYVLSGTQLDFSDCINNAIQYSEILYQSKSFDHVLCNWRGSERFLGRAIQHPDPVDLQVAADAFRLQVPSPGAQSGATTQQAYDAMLLYLQKYVYWKQVNYLQPGQQLNEVIAAQQAAFNNNAILDNLIKP